MNRSPRIIVVGAGLTGIAAAIAAREAGADVLVLEKGAQSDLGGNAAFSGGLFLFAYDGPDDLESITNWRAAGLESDRIDAPAYDAGAYAAELMGLSGDRADPDLVRVLAAESGETMRWLVSHGVQFEFGTFGAYVRERVLHVPPGQVLQTAGHGWSRGLGLILPLVRQAQDLGVELRHQAPVSGIVHDRGRVTGVTVTTDGKGGETVPGDAVVIATGGFQASAQLRREHLGPLWEYVRLRGTRHSDGSGIMAALDAGADACGDWSSCHSAAVDPNTASPRRNDVPSPTPMHGFWLGILVNRDGERFVDEGPGPWIRNYSKMGKAVVRQPGSAGFEVFDQKVAATIHELATTLGIPPATLEATVKEFNDAVDGAGFDPAVLDGVHTSGIDPPKSNWAVALDQPPFVAYPVVAGLTFTFAGIRIDPDGHALDASGQPVPGLYAGGEAAGGLFFGDYPGGSALMRSSVFGRRAGRSAAREATG